MKLPLWSDSVSNVIWEEDELMMRMQAAPEQLFYDFCLEDHVPGDNMLRRIDYFLDLDNIRRELKPFYRTIGRASVDPALMIRMNSPEFPRHIARPIFAVPPTQPDDQVLQSAW